MIDALTAMLPLRPMTSVESAAYELGVAPLSCAWQDGDGWHAVTASGGIVEGNSLEEALRAAEAVASLH